MYHVQQTAKTSGEELVNYGRITERIRNSRVLATLNIAQRLIVVVISKLHELAAPSPAGMFLCPAAASMGTEGARPSGRVVYEAPSGWQGVGSL